VATTTLRAAIAPFEVSATKPAPSRDSFVTLTPQRIGGATKAA